MAEVEVALLAIDLGSNRRPWPLSGRVSLLEESTFPLLFIFGKGRIVSVICKGKLLVSPLGVAMPLSLDDHVALSLLERRTGGLVDRRLVYAALLVRW